MKTVVVIGLGNPLLGDEGIGYHLVERLANDAELPRDVEVLWGGTDLLGCAEQMQGRSRVVLLDAMLGAPEPGGLELWEEGDFEALEESHGHAHHLPLIQAVHLLRSTSLLSRATQLTMITVGIESAHFGHGLSPKLGDLFPSILKDIRAVIEGLCGCAATPDPTPVPNGLPHGAGARGLVKSAGSLPGAPLPATR